VKRAATYVLPDGWSMCVDEASGFPMYYCDATGETRWDPPEGTEVVEMMCHMRIPPLKHSE